MDDLRLHRHRGASGSVSSSAAPRAVFRRDAAPSTCVARSGAMCELRTDKGVVVHRAWCPRAVVLAGNFIRHLPIDSNASSAHHLKQDVWERGRGVSMVGTDGQCCVTCSTLANVDRDTVLRRRGAVLPGNVRSSAR